MLNSGYFWAGAAGFLALLLACGLAAAWYAFAAPGRAHRGPLPAMTDEERDLAARLRTHVAAIASVPHNVQYRDELEKAAAYIETQLRAFGLSPIRHEYETDGCQVRNIEAVIPAQGNAGSPSLVIGAHYDSAGDAPGANDNGTGSAAVIELARLLRDFRPAKTTLRLVLFVNEEPPYFRTEHMGSLRYVRMLNERNERLVGMISLETLGCFSDAPGSQRYPEPLKRLFPSTANFIAFVGMPGSRNFLHRTLRSFRAHTPFPTIGGIAPDAIPGIGWSDHWGFSGLGYPAIMITDTALFRYSHYHRPTDTPDKVDYDKLARITKGVERVARQLAK